MRGKNSLSALNEYLFATLDALTDDTLDDAALDNEIKRAKAVAVTSQTIINNAALALKAYQVATEAGERPALPDLLESSEDK